MRQRVVYAGLALAVGLATPTVARADIPQTCDRLSWNDRQNQGDVNVWDRVRGPETAAFTFDCVVAYGMEGTSSANGQAHPGIVDHIVRNTKGFAQALLLLMLLVEFCWVGLFAAEKASEELIGAGIRYLLVALLLANYWTVIEAARQMATKGSMGVHGFLVQATQSTSGTGFASQRAIREQVRMQLAEREMLQLRASDTTHAQPLSASETLKLAKLNETLDVTKCNQRVPTDDPVRMQEARIGCQMIAREQQPVRKMFETLKETAGVLLAPFEALKAFTAKGIVLIVSTVVEFILSIFMVGAFSLVALSFLMIAAIGPFVLPFMGFRRGKGVGAWWFKNLFACAVLPMVMAAAVAIYSATIDYIIWESDNTSPMMVMLGPCIAFPLMVMAMKGGFDLLKQFGGGMAFAGIEIGKASAKLGLQVAQGALTGGASMAASGAGIGKTLLGAARGAGGAMRDATAGAAGTMFQGTERGPSEGAARMARTLTSPTAMRDLAGKVKATAGGAGMATSYDKPTGAVSDLERQHAHSRAGADLGTMLEAGKDYSKGPDGAVRLSASGRQKVAAYRQANRDALRSMAHYKNEDDFANGVAPHGASVAAGITGAAPVSRTLGGAHDGTADRTILEMLHPSLTEMQPGESENPTAYNNRMQEMVRHIKRQAGGSWQGAQRAISRMNNVAGRHVVVERVDETSGAVVQARFGAKEHTLGGAESAVEYAGERNSAWQASREHNAGVSDAKLYATVKRQVMRANPKPPTMTEPQYEAFVHERMFLDQSKPGPRPAAPTSAGATS